MTMRLIPNAAAMTEFVNDPTNGVRYTGTCGEDAGLALAHVVDPGKFPLNAATLSGIARWEIAQKQASANGSEPLSAIASWLTSEGIAHTSYGYSEPPSFDWRSMLATWGGIKPIVFEYAHASNLPGDEAGVAYHFNCCLGWDPATASGLFADGDNLVERRGGTSLVRYTLADLTAASVCGMLVGEYQLGGTDMATIPSGWKDDGATLTAPNGVTMVMGFRDFVLTHAWDPNDVPVAEAVGAAQVEQGNPSLGDGTYQLFKISGQLTWTHARGVFPTWNGQEIAALHTALAAAQSAQSQAQSQVQAESATIGQQTAQIAALQTRVAALQAQVTQLEATAAAPAPTPAPAPAAPAAPTTPADAAALLVQLVYAEAEKTLKAVS